MAQIAFPPGGCVAEPSVPLTAQQLAKVREKITLAKSQLVLKQPFFASLVLQRPLIETDTMTPTAGADARGRIYYNPRFIASKSVAQVEHAMFLLAHETLHVAFHHAHKETVGGRDPRAANIAMDKVINELLIKEGVGEFIEGGQRHAGAESMKWQDLYIEPDPNDGAGGGQGPGGIGDDLLPCPDGEPMGDEAEQLKQQAKAELAAAAQAARMQGKLSANMERMVDDIVYVKTPWHTILERFMTAFVSSDYSWKRPNRRLVGMGIYLPSLDKQPRMGEVVIGVDTSGSIGNAELAMFGGHVNRILETCMPEKVHVVYCDARVAHTDTVEPDELPIKLIPHGGGGTDMREVWRWQEEHAPDAACLVLLTDGYTPWPDKVDVPSVVLSTTEQVAPTHVGETVAFEE